MDKKDIPNLKDKKWLKDYEVGTILSVSRTLIWKWAKEDADFPKPFKRGCSTRWKAEDIYRFAELASSNQ